MNSLLCCLITLWMVPHTFAQQNVSEFIHSLDTESAQLLSDSIATSSLDLSHSTIHTDSENNTFIELASPPRTTRQKEVLFFLGAGLGAIHNYGIHALIIRKNKSGNLSWFLEGELSYLQMRVGYAPDDISIGVGVFPFKTSLLSTALTLHNPSYSEKIGIGPEIGLNQFVGRNKPVRFFLRVSPVIYPGEKNQKGQNFSVLTEASIGMSVKIMKVKR